MPSGACYYDSVSKAFEFSPKDTRSTRIHLFLEIVFVILATGLWWYVLNAAMVGIVQMPRAAIWWCESSCYERHSHPFRYWLTLSLWGVLATLVTIVCVRSLVSVTWFCE
jgi:hypothetical protein